MVQEVKPYAQYLGDSWLEKKTIPYYEKLFKALGIYDVDYHKKYRKTLHSKRYKTYIKLVEGDIRKKIKSANRKLLDEIFGNKKFVCPEKSSIAR